MTAADRPAPPVPATADDAVDLMVAIEHALMTHGIHDNDELVQALHDAALDAAGVPALRAESETRRRHLLDALRRETEARQQVADLRARIEALIADHDPFRDERSRATVPVSDLRAALAGDTTEAGAEGCCEVCGHPDDGNCNCPLLYRPSPDAREDRDALRERVLAVIPAPSASHDVRDWPEDEQDYYRHGDWNDFTSRGEALDLMRREKIVDAVLAVVRSEPGQVSARRANDLLLLAHMATGEVTDTTEGGA